MSRKNATAPALTLFKVTPATLSTYGDCPRRYRFAYVDDPRPPKTGGPWAHLDLGNAVHGALAAWWDLPDLERRPAAAGALVARLWSGKAFRDEAHSAAWQARAARWVEAYLRDVDPLDRPAGIERTVSRVTSGGLNLTGRADRIDVRDTETGRVLRVVDYKTGRQPPEDWEAASSTALAIYAVAAERTLGGRCARAELHHLPTGQTAEVAYTPERLARHVDRITDQVADLRMLQDTLAGAPHAAADLFPTNPGPLCGSCPSRGVCPTGQAAAPPAEPWRYLPEE